MTSPGILKSPGFCVSIGGLKALTAAHVFEDLVALLLEVSDLGVVAAADVCPGEESYLLIKTDGGGVMGQGG